MDMSGSSHLDMAPAPAACPAAKGLPGDNLACADFTNQQTTLADLTSKGWNFQIMSQCPGWEINSQFLQVTNFGNLNTTCALTTPMITTSQIEQYKTLTISIQHLIDLDDSGGQFASIYLKDAGSSTRLMWSGTGKKAVPRQQTIITVNSADLPTLLQSSFPWLLEIYSPGPSTHTGWQIESIAVNGSQ
jgi:hypothetical protein